METFSEVVIIIPKFEINNEKLTKEVVNLRKKMLNFEKSCENEVIIQKLNSQSLRIVRLISKIRY